MIYVFYHYISVPNGKEVIQKNIQRIESVLGGRIIRRFYRIYENTPNIEIEQFKRIFKDGTDFNKIILNNFSLSWEIRELVILIQQIKLRVESFDYTKRLEMRLNCTISPYSHVNSIFNRILDLSYQAKLNFTLFRDVNHFVPAWQEKLKNIHNATDIKMFLITDSIACYNEIIRSCFLYGTSYIISYSFLASCHDKFADWCYEYKYLKENLSVNEQQILEKMLVNLIEFDSLQTISEEYHRARALKYYRFSMDVHKEGREYKKMIENLIYLNDDFNDNFLHFCAAVERYLINIGFVNRKIELLKNISSDMLEKMRGNTGQEEFLIDFYERVKDYE
jgi:hypothetical protein